MHNKPTLHLVQEPRLELRPLITPRLRRAGEPPEDRAGEPPGAGAAAPWRERRYRRSPAT